ncbi:arylesterase [Marinimicrobium alkaliphilum]|uniref:arylesterase n=1 Tax=Marinimicrobium alkaliphilum TaxID=2202654 RepID=UPI000DB93B22|nr:arylesterase [Marinimicrobium alkaliphilum]
MTRYLRLLLCLLIPLSLSLPTWSDDRPVILVMGDSLSASYGIDQEDGWVTLLAARVREDHPHRVINASVSGETTGGGLARLPALLDNHQPDIVILELGGNDGLRGHPIGGMKRELAAMIEQSQDAGAEVLLVGIQIPPNYGSRYTRQFAETFPALAQEYQIPLVPFLLEGVATVEGMMQDDRIHPTAAGQPIMLEHVWEQLAPMLDGAQ